MDTCTPTMVAVPLHGGQFTELYSFFLHVKWVYFHDDVVIAIIVTRKMIIIMRGEPSLMARSGVTVLNI